MKEKLVVIGKALGGSAVVAVALTQLYDWVVRPSEGLQAEITLGSYQVPPSLGKEFGRLYALGDDGWLNEQVDRRFLTFGSDREGTERVLLQAISDISRGLESEIPESTPSEFTRIDGLYQIVVINNGDRAVKSVKLSIPYGVEVLVKREGVEAENSQINEVIELGELQPREVVDIQAWSRSEPSLYSASNVRLTHDSGIGDVSLRAPVGGFGLWIDTNWPLVLFATVALVFIVPGITSTVLSAARKGDSAENDQSSGIDTTEKIASE